MGIKQRPTVLLLLILCLLYSAPSSTDAACCTIGQPKYIGSELVTPWLTIATCSDGPCTGLGYNYLTVGAQQSPQPDSCCDTMPGDPVNGFFYNPQQGSRLPNGSLALWYPNPFADFPGTSKPCSRARPLYQCILAGEQVPTCQDTNTSSAGAQPYVCPAGYTFNSSSTSIVVSLEGCCSRIRPRLALLCSFPAGYTGPTANLRADEVGDQDSCIKLLAPRVNVSGVTVLQPGTGRCAGNTNSGFMLPGTYQLDEGNAPPGTEFTRWDCYNITLGTQGPPINITADFVFTLTGNSSITCVAVFNLLPPPRLALISQFPPEYNGPTASLSATARAINAVCSKPSSPRLGQNGVTVVQPGAGNCGNGDGGVPPGIYTLAQSAPTGTEFDRWDCYDISSGNATNPQDANDITLGPRDAVTCVAVYVLGAQPKLALISEFPDSYVGPTANLTAISPGGNCAKQPSPRLGGGGVTVLQPGPGRCNGDGSVQPGSYELAQLAPAGTQFLRWECFDITSGNAQVLQSRTSVVLSGMTSITCVATYGLPSSSSPTPNSPKLALISQFPPTYTGPTANLSAVAPGDVIVCAKAPSPRLLQAGVTVAQPGPGLCNGDGSVSAGTYGLIEITPPGAEFDRWDCFDVNAGGPPRPDVDSVTLASSDRFTCVAIYTLRPKLALICEFPAGYSGPNANLTAVSPSFTCRKAPAPRINQNGVTILLPGSGQCGQGGFVDQGVYNLTQRAPSGATFAGWRCFDTTTGNAIALTTAARVTLVGSTAVTCVAAYTLGTSPAPGRSPSPNPNPTPGSLPKLALISDLPDGYNGPSANLTATSINIANIAICVEAPSAVLDRDDVLIEAPGTGFCLSDGAMPASNYTLSQSAPPGLRFEGWDCYRINTGIPIAVVMPTDTRVALNTADSLTCVAVYSLGPLPPPAPSPSPRPPATPSPSPSPRPPSPAPSPAPAPSLPKLGLISSFPAIYTGPSASLVADGTLVDCVKTSSPILNVSGVSIVAPGPGLCGVDGSVPAGPYTLTQVPPPGTQFEGWDCYNVTGNTSSVIGTSASITLANSTTVVCVANYTLAEGTCADARPLVTGNQQYTCSRTTMTFNTSAVTRGPATDSVCCMPTCSDRNLTSPTAQQWVCPAGSNFTSANALAAPPSNATCCNALPVQNCFNATKTGPGTVQAGSSFDFKIRVTFSCKPNGSVTVTDTLPTGLQATSAPATFNATYANATVVPGGSCTTTGNSFSCNLGPNYGPGDRVEVTVPVTAGVTARGVLVNKANVSDLILAVLPEVPVTIEAPNPSVPFTVSKSGPSTATAGEAFDYNVAVTFFAAATGVVMVDDLPLNILTTSRAGSWRSVTVNAQNPSGACTTSQMPGTNGTNARSRITCILGATYAWAASDRVEIILPVLAGANATGTINNVAIVTDDKNRTAQDDHPIAVTPAPNGLPYSITKTGPGQSVLAGQPFSYSIIVAFLGTARGVKVTDLLPPSVLPGSTPATWARGRTGTSTSCVTNAAAKPATITCDLGASTVWNAGDTVEITVPVTADLAAATNAINTAIITDDRNRTTNDTFPVNIEVDATAPFTITKTAPAARPILGQAFLFEVIVVFFASTKGVTIVDDMPVGLAPAGNATWTATSTNNVAGGSCTTANRTGGSSAAGHTCDLGASVTWARGDRIRMLVPSVASVILQQLVNRATVRDDRNRTANATAPVSADVNPNPNSLMNIVKTASTTTVAVGQSFVYTIAASFDDVGPFTAAKITDDLPVGLLPNGTATWVGRNAAAGALSGNCTTTPASSPEITCILGASASWASGDTVNVTVPVVAGANAAGNLVNRATLTATLKGQVISVDDTADVDVTAMPGLRITKLGPGADVNVGQTFTYTINTGVLGQQSVNPLILVDELQSTNLKFAAPMPPNCVQNTDQKATCAWTTPVGPSDGKLVQFRVTANRTGTFQNKATVFTTMPGVANQTATAPVTVIATDNPTVIGVRKAGPSQAIPVGQEFTFRLTASVRSGSVATMVLTDSMDAATGITFVRVSPATGCTVAARLLTCNLVAPFPKTLVLTAKGSKAGTFTNRVQVQTLDATATDTADVTIKADTPVTCRSWVAANGCGAELVLNPKNADKVLNDTSNTANIRLLCCATNPQTAPDVKLVKTVSKAQIQETNTFSYTFNATNLGNLDAATAYNVIVTDTFPVGVAPTGKHSIVPSAGGNVCTFSGADSRVMRCTLGTMLQKESKRITVEVVADGKNFNGKSILRQKLRNTGKLTCATSPTARRQNPLCRKNSTAITTVIKKVTPQDDLTVTKSSVPPTGVAGETVFTFTIVVDPGLTPVRNVVLTDRLPPQLINAQLLTTYGGDCAITTAARRTGAPATRNKPRRPRRNDDSPLGTIITQLVGGGGSGGGDGVTTAAQQTLRCNFDTLSSAREIRYTATATSIGTWLNVVVVNHAGGTAKNDSAQVVVTPPPRVMGSCCDSNYGCSSNVDRDTCTSAGGTWSSKTDACRTKMFCSGACCTAGGTAGATCRVTQKAECQNSMFSRNSWSADGDCNSPGFCPKPIQCPSQCQPCDAARPCCGGYSCTPAGNGWYISSYTCQPTRYSTGWKTSSAAGATTAAAVVPAGAAVYATPANVVNDYCSALNGLCGLHDKGKQCCGPKVDCIVGGGLVPRCKPRDSCKKQGSSCGGVGECCSGQVCMDKVCTRAECPEVSDCEARDYTCKYWRQLNCEAFYAAATSSAD